MPILVHLSDLHLLGNPTEQEIVFDELVSALAHLREQTAEPVALLAITGDVFDSATAPASVATRRFEALHAEMCGALGRDVPTVIEVGS